MDNTKKYNTGCVEGDGEIARAAEELAIKILSKAMEGTKFSSLHDEEDMWHVGDIVAEKGDKKKYIDVKDDGRINHTHNVFCEDYKIFKHVPGYKYPGFMRNSEYDYLAVLDQVSGKLYLLDFKKLQKVYTSFYMTESRLSDCVSYGHLAPLYRLRSMGIIKCEIFYTDLEGFICINKVV